MVGFIFFPLPLIFHHLTVQNGDKFFVCGLLVAGRVFFYPLKVKRERIKNKHTPETTGTYCRRKKTKKKKKSGFESEPEPLFFPPQLLPSSLFLFGMKMAPIHFFVHVLLFRRDERLFLSPTSLQHSFKVEPKKDIRPKAIHLRAAA